MLRKLAFALGLTALVGTAGALASTTQAEAGWRGPHRVVDRTVVVHPKRPVHYAPRAHRHRQVCVVKRDVRMTPRGPVKVVKRICR